jgi:hypothetical protein
MTRRSSSRASAYTELRVPRLQVNCERFTKYAWLEHEPACLR